MSSLIFEARKRDLSLVKIRVLFFLPAGNRAGSAWRWGRRSRSLPWDFCCSCWSYCCFRPSAVPACRQSPSLFECTARAKQNQKSISYPNKFYNIFPQKLFWQTIHQIPTKTIFCTKSKKSMHLYFLTNYLNYLVLFSIFFIPGIDTPCPIRSSSAGSLGGLPAMCSPG